MPHKIFSAQRPAPSAQRPAPSAQRPAPSAMTAPSAQERSSPRQPPESRPPARGGTASDPTVPAAGDPAAPAFPRGHRRPGLGTVPGFLAALLAAPLIGNGGLAHAQPSVLASNTGQTPTATQTISSKEQAQPFSTGSNMGGYTLTSIELDVLRVPTSTTGITVALWSATGGGHPNAVLHTLTHPSDLSTTGLKTFSAPANTVLTNGTKYFIFVSYDGGGTTLRLKRTTSATALDAASLAGWSTAARRSRNRGSSTGWVIQGGALLFKINGSAVAAANDPPTISPTAFDVAEGGTEVGTVMATDDDTDDSIESFEITGGADMALFSITTAGVLRFLAAPDYENPTDVASTDPPNMAGNNEYIVTVSATSGTGDRAMTTEQTITVTVTDVNEIIPPPSGTAVWSATLTVKNLPLGKVGCTSAGPSTTRCSTSSVLTDDDFTYDGTTYAVTAVLVETNGDLAIIFDTDLTTAAQTLTVEVDGTAFAFEDADDTSADIRIWEGSGLSWAAGDQIALKLTEPLPPATLAIADAQGSEQAGAIAFAVTLNEAATGRVTVEYATADGTATAGEDYTQTSGTLTFADGETAQTVSVPVADNEADDGDRSFTVTLSSPAGAGVALTLSVPDAGGAPVALDEAGGFEVRFAFTDPDDPDTPVAVTDFTPGDVEVAGGSKGASFAHESPDGAVYRLRITPDADAEEVTVMVGFGAAQDASDAAVVNAAAGAAGRAGAGARAPGGPGDQRGRGAGVGRVRRDGAVQHAGSRGSIPSIRRTW